MHRLLLLVLLPAALTAALDPAQLAAARELYGQRQDAEALAAYEKLTAADPQNAEAQHHLGLLAMRRDEPEGAVKFLEKAAALNPGSSEYQRRLGDACGRTAQKASLFSQPGWAKRCRTAYEKAVGLDPKNLEARFSLMGFYQQAPGIVGGGMDKAYAQAEEIRKLDAGRGRAALAGLYVADKKYNQAFTLYQEVLKEAPDDYSALYQIGRLAAVSGERLDYGATALKKCLALTPTPDQPGHAAAHWRLGNIQEKQGDKTAARASYEAALKVDANFRQAKESLKNLK